MKNNDYKKQHIVPVCYLANFSIDKDKGRKSRIFFYHKNDARAGQGILDNFPYENNFYDIPELGESIKVLEKFFCQIEGVYAKLLRSFIQAAILQKCDRDCNHIIIPKNVRDELAAQFAIQYLRTNYYRDYISNIFQQMIDAFLYAEIPTPNKKYLRHLHTTELLSFKMANFFANLFDDRKWVVLVNHTNIPFWTSDNPIICINHSKQLNLPAADCRLTYYIPISPEYAIEMYQRPVNFIDLMYFDIYNSNDIMFYNSHIKDKSQKLVFSNKDFNEQLL